MSRSIRKAYPRKTPRRKHSDPVDLEHRPARGWPRAPDKILDNYGDLGIQDVFDVFKEIVPRHYGKETFELYKEQRNRRVVGQIGSVEQRATGLPHQKPPLRRRRVPTQEELADINLVIRYRKARSKEYRPPKDELRAIYTPGMIFKDLAEKYGVSTATIGKWLRFYKIPLHRRRIAADSIPKKELIHYYRVEGLSCIKISKIYNVNTGLIGALLRSYGVKVHHGSKAAVSPGSRILRVLYVDQQLRIKDIAKRFKAGLYTVRRWLKEAGIHVKIGRRRKPLKHRLSA